MRSRQPLPRNALLNLWPRLAAWFGVVPLQWRARPPHSSKAIGTNCSLLLIIAAVQSVLKSSLAGWLPSLPDRPPCRGQPSNQSDHPLGRSHRRGQALGSRVETQPSSDAQSVTRGALQLTGIASQSTGAYEHGPFQPDSVRVAGSVLLKRGLSCADWARPAASVCRVGALDPSRSDPVPPEDLPMADLFYFARDQEQFGPFSAVQLKEFAASRRLQPTDTVWKEGMKKAVLAATVNYLFPDAPATGRPADTKVEAASGPVSSPRPATSPAPGIPTSVAPSAGTLTPADAQTIPAEPRSGMIPAPGHAPPAVSLAPRLPSGEGESEGRIRELSPASTADTERKSPSGAPTTQKQARSQPPPMKKGRVTGAKGAVIISQDGEAVRYRMKCIKCSYEHVSQNRMPIKNGCTRVSFFCPKCKRRRPVEIYATI